MITNPASSALNLITHAQQKANDATHTIASLSVSTDETGSSEMPSSTLFKPILSLKEAELEHSAAVKVLQSNEKTLGGIINEQV